MSYTKPEINVLGGAVSVIQILNKPYGTFFESVSLPANFDPAYDLDE